MHNKDDARAAIGAIECALAIVNRMDKKAPSEENKGAITGLEIALKFLTMRKKQDVHKATN